MHSVPDRPLRLTHRPAGKDDLSLVCSFPTSAEELFYLFPRASFPLTPNQLLAVMETRRDSTLVLADDEPAAFANFHQSERGGVCALGNVIVAPQLRGRGVGRYLVEVMLHFALTRHEAEDVLVSCFNRNTGGLLFYSKLGFRPFLIEPRVDHLGREAALIHLRFMRAVR